MLNIIPFSILPVRFIMIDGHGGSGKSTLAENLSNRLSAEIVHTDDFANPNNTIDWWKLIIQNVFDPIKKGNKILSYPRSKWSDSHNPDPVINQPVTEIMILEGVNSLRSEFRPYVSYGIFVDTPKNICLSRGLSRDCENNPAVNLEALRKQWEEWFKEELEYMNRDNPKLFANIVVSGESLADIKLPF